jgi:hypothetical protein
MNKILSILIGIVTCISFSGCEEKVEPVPDNSYLGLWVRQEMIVDGELIENFEGSFIFNEDDTFSYTSPTCKLTGTFFRNGNKITINPTSAEGDDKCEAETDNYYYAIEKAQSEDQKDILKTSMTDNRITTQETYIRES